MPTADALEEIRRLYFNTTKKTIQKDLARAVELLKSMANEDERQRAAAHRFDLGDCGLGAVVADVVIKRDVGAFAGKDFAERTPNAA